MTTQKTTVIYHSADFDGLFCREIAHKFLPDAELIGWDFGDKPLEYPPEGTVYVLDLPVDRVFGFDFTSDGHRRCLERCIWIDHHKSSIESHPATIPGYRIDGVAACRLAWQWFTRPAIDDGASPRLPQKQDFIDRKVSEPWAVRLAGEYDIWDKRDPDAELFQHGLKSEELYSTAWDDMLNGENPGSSTVVRLLNQGRALQYARAQEYAQVITNQGFDIEFEGLKFLACCSHECDIRSHLFAAGVKPHHDALFGFTFTGKAWRVSLYHAPGKEHHDLSEIAKKHGGGGHRGACGFITNGLPFLP